MGGSSPPGNHIEEAAKKFVLEQVILISRIPKVCVSKNGTLFIRNKFGTFLHHFGIQQEFSSVGHPQGNGTNKDANKIIFYGIKKRLREVKGLWVEELSWVLWATRTTLRSSTGETPFILAYGIYVLVPVEVSLDSYCMEVYNMKNNEFGLRVNMDLLEENREVAHQRNLKYQLQASQYYDQNIKKRSFQVGDLVLRELATSMPTKQGKVQPNQKAPYSVIDIIQPCNIRELRELYYVNIM